MQTFNMSAPLQDVSTRKRFFDSHSFDSVHQAAFRVQSEKSKDSLSLDGTFLWLAIFIFNLTLLSLVSYRISVLPEPQIYQPHSPLDVFYESNARIHLEKLMEHGPRVTGSEANEKFAYNYILNELKNIKANALHSKQISIDEQTVTGSFDIAFLSDFVSYYRNLKNIVVFLKGSNVSEHSLLMSCHFDSAVESPGAGDNAISCSVMIEMLRAFSVSQEILQHNLIFLFNGAEENLLQASHGFITQHSWAKTVKAFVNVDSAGAGGWEIVFQTGPAHPWLVAAYAESVPYPSGSAFAQELFESGHIPGDTDYRIYRDFGDVPGPAHPWLVRAYAEVIPYPAGSILGQELFQTGVIPSDTDYRIFKEFGEELPGLDIAYILNGYVYHTKNDLPKFIQPGCIQRGGENLMALLRKLASSPKLADPGLDKHGTMVFFDVLGYFMVHYPQRVGVIINCALVAAVLFKVIRKVLGKNITGMCGMDYLSSVLQAMFFIVLTWVAIVMTCILMAAIVTLTGCSMSWFTHTINMVGLFMIPGVITMISVQEILRYKVFQAFSPWQIEELYFDANLVIWSSLTLVATLCGMGSAYFPMLFVLGPLIIRDRTLQIFRDRNIRKNPAQFILLHLASLIIPHLLTMYILYCLFILFIPIMARLGTEVNPDIVVGGLNSVVVIMLTSYLMGLCYICSSIKRLLSVLCGITVVWLFLIVLTPLGFPFGGNPDQPTPMRLLALDTYRRAYDRTGVQIKEDSGIWVQPFDYTKNKHSIDAFPILENARPMECDFGPYCGVPLKIPVLAMLHPKQSLYLKGPPNGLPPITCKLVDRQVDPASFTKLSFEVEGPDHISMYIRPKPGVSLDVWSLTKARPEPAKMPTDIPEITYYVYYSYGEKPDTPWAFSLYFMVPTDYPENTSLVDIAFAGHYLHGENKQSKELEAFLKDIPDWMTPVTWSATYDGYEF